MTNDSTEPTGEAQLQDTSGLLQASLTTYEARNAAELETIALAYDKYIYRAKRKKRGGEWLTDKYIRSVHHDMFGAIWDWAGKYRTVTVNIGGISPQQIPIHVRDLIADFKYWDSVESTMQIDEIAAHLQNRLTKIHPFKDGNGRHARLITDIFYHSRGASLPKWPQIHRLPRGEEVRGRYIVAMKAADDGDFSELIAFIQECRKAD